MFAIACATVPQAAARAWPDAADLDRAVHDALAGKQTRIEVRPPTQDAGPPSPAIEVSGGPLGGFLELFTYLLVTAGAVLLITVLVRGIAARNRGDGQAPSGDAAEIETAAAVEIPDAATVAAARGDFGEALRLLLGEILPRFYRGKGRGWPAAWTSRQCLRRVARAEPARSGLAELILTVERHHFGGLPAARSDWETWERRAGELLPSAAAGEAP